jgi:hypothetical protein
MALHAGHNKRTSATRCSVKTCNGDMHDRYGQPPGALDVTPEGHPERQHFQIVESASPTPAGSQVLVRNLYLSIEPACAPGSAQ